MANNIIKGRKGGGSKQRTPTEQPDDLQSVAKAKILLALGEGEFAGGLTGKDIYLDGTPLENADGSQNFSGVSWEFRPGTQAQTYIQGIPGTENEISVGTEVSSKTAWTHTFTNTQLSAVRVRLKWPSLMKQEDDGDVVGNTVKYAIDLQTDGGAWQTVLETAVTGKTTSGYERSHRIDLPQAGSTWTLRLRKISPDANSVKVGDVMTLQSYTEVIDAKLRYPNTALLYIEFDSSQFNGSIPQISCEPRGRVIRVPDNYNPETREYTGVWTGGFKWAWTDNPAWIYYDIVIADRFGLGNRLSSVNISKWTLYQIAQYCDQLVPDGRGGDGMEPRYTCNVYVQERNDAYTVLRDFAAIFRGMTCWNGEQIVVQADMPRDVDFTYTRANIVGKPRYSSSSSQVRYTNALVSWSDPDNAYADAMEPAFIPELVSRYSFNQLELTAIGCTRQSEAHRKGLWGILTNNKDRVVEFDVGLDGRIPQPGYIIALADELLAGRVNGGRISAVNGRVITLDRDVDAKPGDRLQLNLPSGISQSRTIQAVNGRRQITVTTAYSETPERECVWAVESNDLFLQQYRVTGVKENGDATLTITGVSHDPDKFARIDTGAIIDQRPVSVLPAGNQSPPDDIVITSRSVVNQGISVETMQVNWSAVSGAIAYEAQWRRNDGNWINVPRSSTTSFEVSGIYAGRYLVRVRAINAAEISSGWAYSEEKTLTGKVGEPLAPLALATRSLVHGVQVSWEFPTGSGDTLRTELQYSKNQDGSAPMPLSDVAYPGKSYQQMGLSMGAEFWYRARLVDRLGNESPWTGWVQGMASDNFDDYYENLTDAIKDTAAWEETQRTISETQEGIRNTQQELEQTAEALRKEAEDQAKQVSQDIDASAKSITADVDGKISAVNKTITDEITSVNEALDSGLAQANKGVQEAKSAVADANKQIATMNKSLTDSITQVRQSVTDTAAEINATIDLEIARVSKTLADGDAALNAQIKTAENGLKQSLSQVNTSLTNAVKQETADRIADVNAKAAQAADELLAATQGIEASIESLTQVMKSADENLAREMSSLAAGANIQFDSQVIWHFNNQTTEGWTGSAGVPGVSQDGWLRPADSATDPYITSPGGLAVDGAAYRFIMLRFRKTGKPVWAGEIRWVSAGENFNNTKRYIVAEPEYADGVATLTVRDIPWTGNIDRIRLDLTNQQDASNFIEFDWIAVGRPAPGASTAALQDVRSTLSNALTAEAQARSTLAAQMRGSYDGSDLEKVTSGLLYQEKTARVTAISAEVKARESLQTQFNDNKAAVSGELSSLTTEQSAQASRIGGLETSLGKKADASALQSLTQKVELQGTTLTSQGNALTSLTNRVGKAESGVAANSNAITGLQSTVSQQGNTLTSQGQSITRLQNDLSTANGNIAKKADATALQSLQNTVEQHGKDLTTQSGALTSLQNSLNTTNSNVAQKASAQSVSDLTSRVTSAEGKITSQGQAITKLQGDLSSTNNLVSTKADSTALQTLQNSVTQQGNDISGQGSRVTSLENNLTAGANLIPNPAMLNGAQGWGGSATTVDGYAAVVSSSGWGPSSSYFQVTPGDIIDLSLMSQSAGAASISWGLRFDGPGLSNFCIYAPALTFAAGEKKSVSAAITVPAGATKAMFQASARATSARTVYNIIATRRDAGTKANSSAIDTLNSTVKTQGDTLSSIGSRTTSLENSLKTTNDNVSKKADSTALQTLQNTVTQQGKDITSSSSAITSLQNGLVAANSNIDKKADATALQSLQNTVEQHGKDLTTQSGALTSLQNSLNTTNSNVAQKASAQSVSDLTSRVTSAEGKITSQGQAITKLQGDLSSTNNLVSTKADSTALQTLQNSVTQQGNDISGQGSRVTSLENNLTAGANLIPNPAMLNGAQGWGGSATTVDGYAAVVSSSGWGPSSSYFQVTPGDIIDLSLMSQSAGAASISWGLRFDGPGLSNFCIYAPALTFAAGEKKSVSAAITVPAGATKAMFQASAMATSERTVYNIIATRRDAGTKANSSAIDTLNSTVKTQGDTLSSIGSRTTSLENSLKTTNDNVSKKADSTALQTLQNTVTQQGKDITSSSSAITSLQNGLVAANSNIDKKADATALQSLQNTVEQHGKDLTTQSGALTSLQNSLNTTNAALEKKAEASAVTALTQQVEQNGQDIRSNTNNLTSLSNRLVNGLRNSWSRRIYPIQLASGVALPSFSDIRAVAPTTVDEVADTTKLDFTFAGSYLVALYSCQVKVAANTTVTMGPGSRVFDDTGVVFVNGVQVAWGNASTSTVSFELKAGWNTVEFLVNQWTGQAYINLGLKLSDKVDEMYSGLGVSALSNAAGVLSSNVSQIGKDVVSNSQSITQLRNSLTQTDANVAGKADQTALNSLTGRVENTETGLTAANSSITSLNTSLSQQSRRGANLLPDGTFESYPANYNLSNNRVIVSTDDSHGGNKCIRVTRPNDYNATGIDNSDNHIFSGFQVRDNAVFYLECWIKLDAKSTAMADNVQISVGLSFQYQDESWQWPAVTKAAKDLSSTQWTKVSGYLKSTKSGVKQAMFRISVPNVSSVKAGNSFLIDDIVLTEVTDAYNAQNTADANASAISTLNSTVSQQGDQLTSQGNSITKLTNDLATTNNNVSKKADATALTTLANRVTQTEKDITSTSSSVTTLNNKVDSISVGGTNLIKNSGAMTGWSNVISETYRGNAVLGATTKAGSGYKDLREITLDAPVDAGEYVYSFYAKGAVDGQPMTVFFYNPNTTKSSETSQGIKSGNTDGRAYFTLTTSWARYWVKWKHTPTTGTKRLILCRIESNASNDQTVYISSPKLEVGNVVSDWNNSPTDSASASAVDLLTTTVNQHSDTITSIGNRTTSLENGLSTTNANVAKKADASSLQTLQNTVTQQGNDISSQGTRVTAIENSLTSGANLIPNAKMLNNAQGWDGNATTVDGYAAVSSARGWQPSSAPFEVTPGDTLDLSLMCLVDAAITFAWGLRFDGPSLNNKTVYTNNLSYQAGEKKAVSGTFVVPVGATTARLQPNIGVTAGVTIYNVVVTRRDATTIANSSAIDSLTSTVKTQGDAISSIGNRTTSLENGLSTAQNNIARKADASALQDLRNTVTSQGGDLTAANSSITSLQASMNRRTVFTVTAKGNGNSVTPGVFDESGKNLFSPGRSWALVTFAKQSDGSAVIATSKTYDVFGSANNGATMSADIEALASGTYVCVLTFDEPSGNRGKILSALESLGGTSEVVNSLPYRGAYILLGRKGMRSGDGLELRAPTGGDATAHISTSVEFVNGIMMGLGAAGGVMMKADANASAITTLQNTVKTQGGNIDSLSSSITALENSLRSTNDTVSKKADTTAVSSLTGRVSQVENTITSQSQSITSLTSSINTISTQGANPWVDGTFESYGDGHVLGGGGTAVVVASQKFTGNKSLQVSREANYNGNSDKQLGSWQSVREDAKFRFEFWAMMPADQAPSSGWTTLVGIQSQNAAGQNAWQAAVTVSEASLGARDKWVKFTGIASNNGAGRTRAVVWISTRGATGNGTPGYSLYIDDLVITDVTDAKAAQDASDATASAVSGLTARVTDAEGKITAQAQQQTALASKVDNANSRVDNMAKTLSDSQSTQASLNTSLQSQIDAQAAANIKNQTTLDNTIKSVASITSTQQTHATALEALATQQTTLTSSVGDLSASVQNTAKTVADVNGTVSSLWSMKVETVNGKNVGAGITLGSNGETSDMILYADRFSLFNRNNATAVPVMIAEGNELYIDTARIKNSSLTTAKIADGSITNAKIGNEIRSNDFVDGSRGWRIAKDGSSQFNNVIVRGRVEANSGVFRGTVQADSFIGDIAVAKSYDSLTFRRNQTVQRNGAYQNRGYSMTVVLACTLVCQTYGTGSGLGYTSDITFNIGGQEVTRRIFVDAGNITGGTTAFELRFAARLDADYNNVGFFIRASGRTAAIDYTCTVENITATAFRTDSSSFS
ncbi:hypothetical protein AB185_00920 (plasmid) [Klebsiella oxytoca]|nr:hypothetical protein AB185_00920 [Klebsiella oxytoca]